MKTKIIVSVLLLFVTFMVGCADIEVPKPQNVLKNPIGTNTAKIGMSKAQVIEIYGDPDFKSTVISKNWAGSREEWFYKARISSVPVNAGFLAKDMYLYFDGNSLTKISDIPLGEIK